MEPEAEAGNDNHRTKFSKRSAFCLIFSMIVTQNVYGWNTLFASSTMYPFVVAYTVVALATAIYCLTMCELYSSHPFAGGKLYDTYKIYNGSTANLFIFLTHPQSNYATTLGNYAMVVNYFIY